MKKKGWLIGLAVLAGLTWYVLQDGSTRKPVIKEFTVERGDVRDVLREVGALAPQDPVLLHAPFSGEIKWLVSDGTWVEAGERVLVFDEEALETQVTQLRANVVDKKQQLRLARLQADQAEIAEKQRVENARNDLKLAEIRHRILTTQPVGGNRLVELDTEIKPLEQQLEQLQADLIPLEKNFRASREIYQTALQEWQTARGKLLELKMTTDLEQAKKGKDPGEVEGEPPPTLEDAERAADERQQALDAARASADADRSPYEAKVAAIDAIDAEAQELYILIEIEKRGLPATRLKIDRDIAQLRLAESRRQAESGKRAYEVGALSKARYDQLIADAEAAEGRLEILDYRLEIASRPATEDQVAASEAALATARRAVENAEAIFQREMDILEGNMAVTRAELAEAEGELERNGKGFAAAIEGSITILRAELEVLEQQDVDRHQEITTELTTLEKELEAARARPPHIVHAPSAGLVRLRRRDRHDERLTDIGDRWEKGHTVALLYPPSNMRVLVGINEVNYQRVREGMPCTVRVPALGTEITGASVAHLSRIGRDRVESHGRWVSSQHSGIIEFALSVDLQQEVPAFRQGMTVMLEIETDKKENTLHLPAAAIIATDEGFAVLSDAHRNKTQTVEGAYFADDYFVVTDGLDAGDTVYRIYEGGEE